MSLTRSMLKSMGLNEEQVDTIIGEHVTVTDALKKQRDDYKEDLDKLSDVNEKYENLKKEYDEFKKDVNAGDWQKKYDEEHKAFEEYKTTVESEKQKEALKKAYSDLLTECKVGEKHIDSILRVTDFDAIKLKDDGTLDDVEGLKKKIGEDWSGFITSKEVRGSDVENPPSRGNEGETKPTRAAQLAAKYHDNLYGKSSKEE